MLGKHQLRADAFSYSAVINAYEKAAGGFGWDPISHELL